MCPTAVSLYADAQGGQVRMHDVSPCLALTTHEGSSLLRHRSLGGRQSLYRMSNHTFDSAGLTLSQTEGLAADSSLTNVAKTSSTLAMVCAARPTEC